MALGAQLLMTWAKKMAKSPNGAPEKQPDPALAKAASKVLAGYSECMELLMDDVVRLPDPCGDPNPCGD